MRRDLEKDVVGKRIKEVDVRQGPNSARITGRQKKPGVKSVRKEFSTRLAGHKITKVERKGKYLLMHLEDGDVLVVHFGMSGQFVRATKRQPPPPHTHVVITFQQGGDLRYVDPRTFGEMFVSPVDDLGKVKELAHIAIDPLEDTFTWGAFGEYLFQRAMKMKSLLMDQ